ncbi:MAG TPA: AAA family ATPase [Coriobacteriia bacterium]|jgi:uncharacterized protein YhaN
MRLRRIDAVRFGALPRDSSLGELGDALTVVVGPNEAGKTSYTTLVRHVLYGFPNARSSERQYVPVNDDRRAGRLVFADGAAEWVVERVDGTYGGTAEVRGPEADVFLERLTAGVTSDVYRSVFGFGLDELSDLATLSDIQQRLYATAAGLRVDPQQVRRQLKDRAETLWSAQGRKKRIHALNAELAEARRRVREAEKRADEFRSEHAELDRLVEESDGLQRAAREERLRAGRLTSQAVLAGQLESQIRSADAESERLHQALEEARAQAEKLDLDEGLLARAEAIDELAMRAEWFQDAVLRAEASAERAREARRVLAEALKSLGGGWDEARLAAVPVGTSVESAFDALEERLRETQRHLEETERLASEARETTQRVRDEATALSSSLDLLEDDAQRDAEVRLGAVIELLKHPPGTGGQRLPAAVAAGLALVMGVAGAVMGDWLVVAAALLPLGLAAYLAFGPAFSGEAAVSELLRAAGLKERPETGLLLALQTDLQRYLVLSRSLWEADGKLAVLEGKATEAARRHAEAAEAWDAWLAESGLTDAADPLVVRALLREVRGAQQARARVTEADVAATTARQACVTYGRKAEQAGLVKAEQVADPVLIAAAVRTAAEKLEGTRTAGRRADQLRAEGDRASAELARHEERTAKAVRELETILDDAGAANDAGVPELEVLAEMAAEEAERAEEAAREALRRRSELQGRLETVASEDAGARVRLEEAALLERLGKAVEEYAVTATALGLVEETLALYERERQPAILKRAEDIFDVMTAGRYRHVVTPLGSFDLSVEDAESRSKHGGHLSRGTAEQLYLALRLAYIENLRDVHRALPVLMDDVLVNFDDEGRQAAAATAIAEFAKERQVVFFTCHESVAELFAEASPDHVRLSLGRC